MSEGLGVAGASSFTLFDVPRGSGEVLGDLSGAVSGMNWAEMGSVADGPRSVSMKRSISEVETPEATLSVFRSPNTSS